MTLTSQYYGLTIGPPSTQVTEAEIFASSSTLRAMLGDLALTGETEIGASPSTLRAEMGALALSSTGLAESILAAAASTLSAQMGALALSSSGVDEAITASSSTLVADMGALAITSSGVGDATILGSPSTLIAEMGALAITSSGVSDAIVIASPSTLIAEMGALALTSSGVSEAVIVASPSTLIAEMGALAITSSGVAEGVITASPSTLIAEMGSLAITSSGVAEAVIVASPTSLVAELGALALSSSGVSSHTISASPSTLIAEMGILQLSSVITVPSNASCFQGAGYLNTANEAFLGYNVLPHSGYVAAWYRYDGGRPQGDLQFLRETIFQAQNVQENVLEFGIIRLADFDKPDLYIEKSSNNGYAEYFTWLELDGGPDILDGNWHLLIWGNDFPGGGWYFIVDGVPYLGRAGQNDGTWFKHVQETGIPFEELDLAATRLEAPGGAQNLYGCLDELIVVNNRLRPTADFDATYLWNNGLGKLIPDIQAENFNGLWNNVYNAWRFHQGGGEIFGHEYVDPEGDERFDLTGAGYVIVTTGIPGGP